MSEMDVCSILSYGPGPMFAQRDCYCASSHTLTLSADEWQLLAEGSW